MNIVYAYLRTRDPIELTTMGEEMKSSQTTRRSNSTAFLMFCRENKAGAEKSMTIYLFTKMGSTTLTQKIYTYRN